jgi:hypothetical protein
MASDTSRSEVLTDGSIIPPAQSWNPSTVSNIEEMQWHLLRERLKKIYRQAQQQTSATMPGGMPPDQNVEMLLRLAGAALALLDCHTINDKGECLLRRYGQARWVPSRKRRTCLVISMIYYWMEQPLRIVKRE